MAKTLQTGITRGLLAMGYEETESPSRKYRRFVQEGKKTLWVGKKGALRAGPNATKSVAIGDRNPALVAEIIAEGLKA